MNISKLLYLSIIILFLLPVACGEEKDVCLGFQPIVSLITPSFGGLNGGTSVTIRGVNFCPDLEIKFGENKASSIEFKARTEVSAVTPPGSITGPIDVIVTNIDGKSGTLSNGFTYSP